MSTNNVLLTPQIIANEALAILQNNLVMVDLVHRDYSNEFVKVGDTITVRKPAELLVKDFNGEIETQDIVEDGVQVKIDRFKDVSVKLTSKEQTLDLKNFSEQVIQPAMVALAQQIDEDLCNFAFGEAKGTVLAKTDEPTNLKDIAGLGLHFDDHKAPITDRRLVLSPNHKYRYALTPNLSQVNYAGTNETLREALLGKIYGMETYMDQNMPKGRNTQAGTLKGAVKVTGTKGENKVALTGGTPATGTLEIGDGLTIKGIAYYVVKKATATGGNIAEVELDKPLRETVEAVDAQVIRYNASVAFHKNAFAFVNRPLDLPMGANRASVANANGVSIRVVYGYDQKTKQDTISFDVLYGIASLNNDLAVRLVDDFA